MKKINDLFVEWYDHPHAIDVHGDEKPETDNEATNLDDHVKSLRSDFFNLKDRLHSHYTGDVNQMYKNTNNDPIKNLTNATPIEMHELHSYTIASNPTNTRLIKGEANDSVPHLDSFLSKAPKAPEDFHVYTSVGMNFRIKDQRDAGATHLHLPAFTSTTIAPHTVHDFGGSKVWPNKTDHPSNRYKEVVRIKIPKDSQHGAYIEGASKFSGEHEFLLKRGLKLKFNGAPRYIKHNRGSLIVHDAEIVPHEEDR